MNRYELTAKSLITIESWIIRTGFAFGLLTGCIFCWNGVTIGFSILAAGSAMGIAHNAYLLKQSERRLLVPRINDATADVSIAIVLLMWLIISILIVAMHGFALDRIGFSLLLISFTIWLGWGERLIFWILAIIIGCVFLLCAGIGWSPHFRNWIVSIFQQVSSDSWQSTRNFFGLGMLSLSCFALYRYRLLATARRTARSEKRIAQLLEGQLSNLTGVVADEVEPTADQVQIETTEPAASTFTQRKANFLYGKFALARKGYYWLGGCAAVIIAAMVYSRGNDDVLAALYLLLGIMIVSLPAILFLQSVPRVFRHAWVVGLAENRVATARQIMLVLARRSMILFAVVFFFLAIQSAVSVLHFSSAVFLYLALVGISGLFLWVAARWYRFWVSQSEFGILLGCILLVVALMGVVLLMAFEVIPDLSQFPHRSRDLLANLGIARSLFVTSVIVISIWCWCIHDAPKGIGRDVRLME